MNNYRIFPQNSQESKISKFDNILQNTGEKIENFTRKTKETAKD